MSTEQTTGSDYRSRQRRVGAALRQDTRNRLLEAAVSEFAANGYAATTVTRLAAAAGVSVQTLYLAWGSKRALLRAYMERALTDGPGSPAEAMDRFPADLKPGPRLAELADLVTEIAERASVGWTLYRDAAAVDTEIADDWNELQLLRHGLFTHVIGGIPETALASGLTRTAAIDTAWTIASPETFDLLTHRLDYSIDDFNAWLKRTLPAALLAPAGRRPSR